MCGIAGFIGFDAQAASSAVQAMMDRMVHRGPDDGGSTTDKVGGGWVALGHRRLSIIDLSPLGHQPMTTEDGTKTIVFNGEIYNFQALREQLRRQGCSFKGGSDTEVLLAGLSHVGMQFVEQLQGMYAFALLDRTTRTLTLARDPAGIKPLYYANLSNAFLFASELKPILATGKVASQYSRDAVASYLAYGAVAQPLTIVDGVEMLGAGCQLEISLSESAVQCDSRASWWRMPHPTEECELAEAVSQTSQMLSDAVKDHLIADVPVGVFLSAGIDSTILASYAHLHNTDVRAFTIALSEDKEMDELTIAAETAKRIGIEHVPVTMLERDAEEAAFEWLSHSDQPSIDGLNTFVISKAVRSQGIKVAISGLGADELFGGYPSFTEVPKIASVAKWFQRFPRSLQGLAGWGLRKAKPSEAAEKFLDMLNAPPQIASLAVQRRRLMNDRQMQQMGYERTDATLGGLWLPAAALSQLSDCSASPGWTISKMESTFYQGNTLLRDSDANSMASSLEIRVPFLDQRLLNWIPSLPDRIRFPKGAPSKFLLREAGKQYLDNVHLRRPKSGFTLPLHRWMVGPLSNLCTECLEALKSSSLVNAEGIEAVWNGFMANPTLEASSRALALVSLGAAVRSQKS